MRWENHWAHFLLTRIDPLVALRQFRTMKPRPKRDISIELLWGHSHGVPTGADIPIEVLRLEA
jgi:hypothetical protein